MTGKEQETLRLWGQLPVRLQTSVYGTTSVLTTRIPALWFHADPSGNDGWLTWDLISGGEHGDLGEMFWDFLNLAREPDEALVDFARRYGPLLPTRGQVSPHREALGAWRSLSRGLNAIYDLARSKRGWGGEEAEMRFQAYAPTLAVEALKSQASDLRSSDLLLASAGHLLGEPAQGGVVEHAVSTFLQISGIAPRFTFLDGPPTYGVPVLDEIVGGVVQNPKWEVDGLLPALALSTAAAVRSIERHRCSLCGNFARQVGRAPRPDRLWFGDHDECRAAARQDAIVRYNDSRPRKTERRVALKHLDSKTQLSVDSES